ncbi:hypothetical protein GCM10007383_38170 [Arenibacter certesii]|uniref:Copper oxidase n=2 Tax=Arenibacter certesii TaxID=228955 RepID=A0A918MSA2_9FLAO|nr:hypothetical protein GCM10007383_38170 [Arenibacter certesii]
MFGQSIEGNVDNLPVREYTLTIKEETVNKAGKNVEGMTVNGTIPGPTLQFTEGEYAVIYVKNEMSVETSVHWHGFLLPNFYDGVPYLTTPPIKPGTTFKYEFAIKQNVTYWYHSHTMLQEQSGVFGSIVIHPKQQRLEYDKELVLMLSDWTNEKPINVLRNLKRGNEWYQMKKGTSTPLNRVMVRGALGAQLDFWRQRMEGADIADIYYPAFLVNGKEVVEFPDFKPGEKVRLRIINGSASSQFWLTFGGETPTLISADGMDIVPVKRNKTFIAIAETYDFITTVPENGRIEFRAMVQDGSGAALAYIGNGKTLPAEILSKPDKIEMMREMAKMKMKMGAHALKFQPSKDERFNMKEEYGMKMDHSMMEMGKENENLETEHANMHHSKMNMTKDNMDVDSPTSEGGMFSEYNYDYLKSPEKTTYEKNAPVNEILLNLTGNMSRYIWSMNGVPLSEADKIKIKGNQVTRMTLNNMTMMHHPMHLHGHFFRVINKNGEYSPLKHTVNVPPMQEITIEFYGNEYGDWFFHCHVLYHMMGGMARIISYNTPRDIRMKPFPVSKLIHETDQWYSWGMIDVSSHRAEGTYIASNFRNQVTLSAEYGWNENVEAEFTYERYLHDYLRVFAGINVENEIADSLDEINTTALVGVRYLTPYLFNLDVRMDSKLRPQIGLSREIIIFPKTVIFGEYEYQADFGWVDKLPSGDNFKTEASWSAGIEYFLSKNFSIMGSYDNRYGAGGGLSARF